MPLLGGDVAPTIGIAIGSQARVDVAVLRH